MMNGLKSKLMAIISMAIVVCSITIVIFGFAMTPGCQNLHLKKVEDEVRRSVVRTPQDSLIETFYRLFPERTYANCNEFGVMRGYFWIVPKDEEIPYEKLDKELLDWVPGLGLSVWLYTSPQMGFNFYCNNHTVFPISPEGLTLDIQSLSPDKLMHPERIYCFTGSEGVVYRSDNFVSIGWKTIDSRKFQFKFPPNQGLERYWEVSMYYNENSMYDGIRRYQQQVGGSIDENPWEIVTLKFLQPAASDSITGETFDNDRLRRYPRKISRPQK